MKEIPLGNSGLVAFVDDDDYDLVSQYAWHVRRHRRNNYAAHEFWTPKRRVVFMHQLIIDAPPGTVRDHIDRNGLNNQRHNLRAVSQRINSLNRRMQTNNSSGYRGVSRDETGGWQAIIRVLGKNIRLGRNFPTPEEAARAWDEAARKYRGEFAVTNFSD